MKMENDKKNYKEQTFEKAEQKLYNKLNTDTYRERPYEVRELGEGMAVVNEDMWGWWKPRFLVNHNTKCAYEFMNRSQELVTVTVDDIDWDSLEHMPEDVLDIAKRLSFNFPSFIRSFKNGVAEVSWQLNPDGRYYMDEDGFGMTNDKEVEIYGFIDTQGKVLVKFKAIKGNGELNKMRQEAESIVKDRNMVY